MSILNQEIKKELPVNLRVCKRGGADSYQNGKIALFTEKAILVQFEQEQKEVWLSKRNVYDNGDNYGCCAKMWLPYARVTVKPISATIEEALEGAEAE